jgi:hypothetical protein
MSPEGRRASQAGAGRVPGPRAATGSLGSRRSDYVADLRRARRVRRGNLALVQQYLAEIRVLAGARARIEAGRARRER